MARMTDKELSALLAAEQSSALGFMSGDLKEDRETAMEYYLGDPFGNEQEGRSKVVMHDVADTIEWILPSLLKVFTAGDEVVRFEPTGPEDEEAAKQATDYVNFVFTKDNPGFLVMYSLFKDALLQKNGIAKVWWEVTEKLETQRLPGLDEMAYAVAAQEAEAQGWDTDTEIDDETGLQTLIATRMKKSGKVAVEPVPPEEFMISRNAKTIADAAYVAHRTPRTASSLIAEGYSKSLIDGLAGDDDTIVDGEKLARHKGVDDAGLAELDDTVNRAMRKIMVTEAYVLVDWDGDGIAEMRKVLHAGKGCKILDNEPWDGPRPFISVTPIIMPHRFYGMSVAELVMDLQLIKSTILRQILDNLYLSNNGRHVISDKVNIDDLLASRPGGIVRLKDGSLPNQGHVVPLVTPLVAAQAFPMLEYLDGVKENRTGVTRYNQGVDADSLNKTASGISQIMSAAQQRTELIARVFAETGVKDLFKVILYLVRTHQDKARVIRLRNEWVPMAPATWPEDFDVAVSVGLGTGNRDMMAQHLLMIAQSQIQAVQLQGGASGPLVTLENLYNTGNKLAQALGWKEEGLFFTDPATANPQPPKPDPEMVKIETQAKIEMAKLQQKDGIDTKRLQLDVQKAMAELNLQKIKSANDDSFRREQHGQELGLKRDIAATRQFGALANESGAGQGDRIEGAASLAEQLVAGLQAIAGQAAQIQAGLQAMTQQHVRTEAQLAELGAPKQISGRLPSGAQFNAIVSNGKISGTLPSGAQFNATVKTQGNA